ncbi:MAG: HNH endonuclease [Dehalococcoidales bacterium]|jgi:5-methylcytosine-specific restriction endonuclease McrA|nr:HNH endonuclease [Dehalococcoidales bacterium]
MYDSPVLVLNQSYEPLNVCHARRAIVMVIQGKAEMLENGMGFIHSANDLFPIPSVIKLDFFLKRIHNAERKLTRLGVFHRDNYTCQYCGKTDKKLTLDHVIPRSHGGQHIWENITTACVPCNLRKAGRTPEQANMKLNTLPAYPRDGLPFFIPRYYRQGLKEWQKYLEPYSR